MLELSFEAEPFVWQGETSDADEGAIATKVMADLLARGERDASRLTSEAFYALNPARNRRKIASGETAAIAQWQRLRRGVVARLLKGAPAPASATAVRAAGSERGAGGTTHYLKLDGVESGAAPLTSIHIPDGFRATDEVDAILYLHGHKQSSYAKHAIDRYWRDEKRAPMREGVASSCKNVILVTPTLGRKSEASGLARSGGLDRYLARVLDGANRLPPWRGRAPRLRHLVLAAHSGGGLWMNVIARAGDQATIDNLRECWGFDCFYNPKYDKTWPDWARRYPDKKLYAYYATESPRKNATTLIEGKAPNVTAISAKKDREPHWDMLRYHWPERIADATFLALR